MLDMKRCARCHETKPLSAYWPRGAGRPGQVQSMCRACGVVYRAAWREKHRTGPRPFLRTPAGLKHCKRCDTIKGVAEFARRADRPGGRVAYCRPCWLAAKEAHRKTPRGLILDRQRSGMRRARRRETATGPVDYAAIYQRDGGRCWICWLTVPLARVHFDHVEPLAKGGAHTEENIRVACQPCNDRKRDSAPEGLLIYRIGEEVRRMNRAA